MKLINLGMTANSNAKKYTVEWLFYFSFILSLSNWLNLDSDYSSVSTVFGREEGLLLLYLLVQNIL